MKDYNYVFKNIAKITDVEDAFLKITAAIETKNPDYIREIINDNDIKKLNDSNVNYLLSTLKV